MTASRALRNESVARETRLRILRTAERLGYEFRVRQGRPRRPTGPGRPTVDLIMGATISPYGLYNAALLMALGRALERRGRDCAIRTCGSRYEDFVSLSKAIQSTAAEGVLIAGYLPARQIAALLACHPRCLLVDHTGDPAIEAGYESVAIDYEDAARQAVRHLLALGRKRIALLMGSADHYFSRDIARGYADILHQSGLPRDRALELGADFSAEGARAVLAAALAAGLRFDALFTNDEMALGALRALHDAGKRVPADVAVVGCDGLPIGQCSIPSLTTIRVDVCALAEQAVAQLLDRPDHASAPRHLRPCAQLEIRESA